MSDLSPKWDGRTIALLLGLSLLKEDTSAAMSPGSVAVKIYTGTGNTTSKGKCSETAQAMLTFASRAELLKVVTEYQGIAVPMTHGYHYYTFSAMDGDGADAKISGGSSTFGRQRNNVDSEFPTQNGSPPLHLQLMALPTKELDRRIIKFRANCIASINNDESESSSTREGNKRCRVYKHASLCAELAKVYGSFRPERHIRGVPVPAGSTGELLNYLRSCTLWPPTGKQRRGVSAGNYLTVRKQHPSEHDLVWNLCRDLIQTVIPDTIYNALAITKSFRGSPHVDSHDKTFQHVIALGDFTGGMLCAEADEDGVETLAIDVYNSFGRIDGRYVHWVSGWTGERYSIVYYSTAKQDWTEPVPQKYHTKWMASMQNIERGLCL